MYLAHVYTQTRRARRTAMRFSSGFKIAGRPQQRKLPKHTQRGSKYSNNEVLGPKYHLYNGFWSLIPLYFGPWALQLTKIERISASTTAWILLIATGSASWLWFDPEHSRRHVELLGLALPPPPPPKGSMYCMVPEELAFLRSHIPSNYGNVL